MNFADFKKSVKFLIRCTEMLENRGFTGNWRNGRNFWTLYGHVNRIADVK